MWIEVGRCNDRESYQVYWRSRSPEFAGAKRQYIGMCGSAAHRQALRQCGRSELEIDRIMDNLVQQGKVGSRTTNLKVGYRGLLFIYDESVRLVDADADEIAEARSALVNNCRDAAKQFRKNLDG